MSRFLIVYGSTYGQTERVSQRICTVLKDAGHVADIYRGDVLPAGLSLSGYDALVIAASVLMGHHQKYITDFVRRHVSRLNEVPSAFVSVCGAAGGNPPQAQGYIDSLLRQTGWRPRMTRSFTGAVAYTRYKWWFRWYLKVISHRKGLPTDTSRDWDFAEWNEVDRFAGEIASMPAPAAAGAGARQ